MAINFLPQVRPGEGVNGLLDFSPLAGAVGRYTQGVNTAKDLQNQQAIGAAYNTGGNSAAAKIAGETGNLDRQMQFQQSAKMDKDRQIKFLGGLSQAVKNEPDPARKELLWNTGLKRAGINPQDMDPEELDFKTGPDIFIGLSGQAKDPLDVKLKEAQIQKALRPDSAPDDPNAVREYKFYQGLPEDQRKEYLDVKRQNYSLIGDSIMRKPDGSVVANVGDNLANAKRQEVTAQEEAKNEVAIKASLPKARASLRALETQHRNVRGTIERAREKINGWTTALAGQALSNLGGTEANDLRTLLNTVKSNLGFDKLQDMRDNSPTGGALGQVAVAELEMLQSAFTSVEQSQTGEQLKENLDYLFGLIGEMQDNRRMAFDDTYGQQNRPESAVRTVNSPEEAANLPSGTRFKAPDGNVYEVP